MNRTLALRVLSPLTEQQLSVISANASVLFLSGFTAAGKDTVLTSAMQVAREQGVLIRPVVKLSDRSLRREEARHFRGVRTGEFRSMLQAREILLPYKWFGRRYGFSVADFLAATTFAKTVVLQMTDLRIVPEAVAAFRAFDIRTAALFVRAPLQQLILRTLRRALPPAECVRRLSAAPLELAASKLRMEFQSEYHHIHNNNGSLIGSVDRVVRIVAALQDDP